MVRTTLERRLGKVSQGMIFLYRGLTPTAHISSPELAALNEVATLDGPLKLPAGLRT